MFINQRQLHEAYYRINNLFHHNLTERLIRRTLKRPTKFETFSCD